MRRTAPIFLLIILLITALCTCASFADVIVLKDGTRLEGEVKRSANGWTVKTADGKSVEFPADRVKSIEVGKGSSTTKNSADQAMSSLLSLRRSVENVADLKQIIDRYHRFIDQYKNSAVATEAQKDLAIWQDRLERGLVKLGSRWVTAQERTESADKALLAADQARDLIVHGRLHDADTLLTQALDTDPACAPALYLRGVIQYQQNQFPAARKSFEAVAVLIADHAPSLNNLAVILWRQNAQMPAVAKFDLAMTASPVNKQVLDNVAEALAALPDNDRKNRIAREAFRRFSEQDARLQQTMAAQGLYRWGSTWVDRATMEQFRAVEKEVNEKITVAKTEADAAEKEVRSIDSRLDSIDRSLRQIENDSVARDPTTGKLIRYPYPPTYYDLQSEQAKLKADRTSQVSKANTARAQVKTLQAQLPKPKYTGLQQLIGAEGVPVMVLPGQPPPTGAPSPASPAPSPATDQAASPPQTTPPAPSLNETPAPSTPSTSPSTQPADPADPMIPAPAWPPPPPTSQPSTQPTTQPSSQPTTQGS